MISDECSEICLLWAYIRKTIKFFLLRVREYLNIKHLISQLVHLHNSTNSSVYAFLVG